MVQTVYTRNNLTAVGQQKSADVQLSVYIVYTQCIAVHTCSVHTPTILQFGVFGGGYSTAALLECTTHGDTVYPELEYMYM